MIFFPIWSSRTLILVSTATIPFVNSSDELFSMKIIFLVPGSLSGCVCCEWTSGSAVTFVLCALQQLCFISSLPFLNVLLLLPSGFWSPLWVALSLCLFGWGLGPALWLSSDRSSREWWWSCHLDFCTLWCFHFVSIISLRQQKEPAESLSLQAREELGLFSFQSYLWAREMEGPLQSAHGRESCLPLRAPSHSWLSCP